MSRFFSWISLVVFSVVLTGGSAFAQGHKKAPAVTDINNVDRDYYYQGEYFGSISLPFQWQRIGFQVVAQGNGKFNAVAYTGGLPGSGWDGENKNQFSGELKDGVVWFPGGKYSYLVEGHSVMVFGVDQRPLGQLPKVQRISPTLGQYPPHGARVLFNGTDASQFKNGRMTYDRLLKEGSDFKDAYGDFSLHLEFKLPYMPTARGQGRSNSGVYLQSRYEVQILDSFGLEGVHNECGGVYKTKRPDVNMCFPPLTWQTYDIDFTAAKFDENGSKTHNTRLTVWHNGVMIHNNIEVKAKTGGGSQEGPETLPTKLQDHGNPVRFRNIWLAEHDKPIAIPSPPNFYQPRYNHRYRPKPVYWLDRYAPELIHPLR